MTFRLIRADDVTPQPWRNGCGRTRELVAWPDAHDWRLRVSVADIESDGPFSSFPGVHRSFAVIEGVGVELDIDGDLHRLTRNDAPFAFDGNAPASCRLIDGPTRDLNLMLRGARGAMLVCRDGEPRQPAAATTQCGLFAAVAGRCIADGREIDLPPYSLLWFETAPSALAFVAGQRPAAPVGWWLDAEAVETAR